MLVWLAAPASAQVRSGFNVSSYPSARTQGAAASGSGVTVYGGYDLGIFEGETGNGFSFGVTKDIGTQGLFVGGLGSFLWYDGFNVQTYEGGVGYRFWRSGASSLAGRFYLGIEHCCGEGFSSTDFAFEPGVVFNYDLNNGLILHLSYGLRMVNFEGEIDKEQILTFGIGKRF
jgi:hypothetical protein